VEAVQLIAGQLAVSLENALLYEKMEERVQARTRELREAQGELVATARQAGMAEIATNVLHNVGNVLNSVNISAGMVESSLRASKLQSLSKVVQLMNEHQSDLGRFLTEDSKGKLLPDYLNKLSGVLTAEQQAVLAELANLTRSVDHIKDIVTTQQSYAGAASIIEPVRVSELVEDALRMNAGALSRREVAVVKEYQEVPEMPLDKARVLQILVNLISNAKQAMDGVTGREHLMTLRLETDRNSLRISVSDQGEGIAPDNLTRIFSHGFTTRKGGHGFGLHSCALAARQMGGTLSVESGGLNQGATFMLELPIKPHTSGTGTGV
jgi:signal transduction histidine kinase